jgi:hypothetical protein
VSACTLRISIYSSSKCSCTCKSLETRLWRHAVMQTLHAPPSLPAQHMPSTHMATTVRAAATAAAAAAAAASTATVAAAAASTARQWQRQRLAAEQQAPHIALQCMAPRRRDPAWHSTARQGTKRADNSGWRCCRITCCTKAALLAALMSTDIQGLSVSAGTDSRGDPTRGPQ